MEGTHAMRHQQVELRLHEARQLAYEYAKQIVLKAYEFSQQQARVSSSCTASSRQNHINNHERATERRAAERMQTEAAAGQRQLDDPIRRRLFQEAAEQINGRFRLSALDSATKQERQQQQSGGFGNPAPDLGGQRRWRRPSMTGDAVTDTSQRPESCGDLDDDSQQRSGVHIEQDYATISSDEQQQRGAASATDHRNNNSQHRDNNQRGRRGRNFQQCLNWHLIVSCFSTCLPQAFGNRRTSATSKTSRSGGPTRV